MATDTKQGLEAALADVNDQIGLITRQINKTNNSNLFTAAEKAQRLADLNTELAGYKAQQTALIQELNQLNLNNNQRNTSSSADVTAQAATARDDSANAGAVPASQMVAVNPDGRVVPAAAVSTAPTNATPAATTASGNVDVGTNAETVTLANSQAIPAASGNSSSALKLEPVRANNASGQSVAVNTGGTAGVGAQREDAAKPPTPSNATTSRLEELYAGAQNAIKSQDNILDQYASYTYSLSWYLLDHDTYNSLLSSEVKYIPSYNLLVQSGGIQIQTSGKPGESPQAQASANVGRNPFFPLDYYLDNFEFSQAVSASPGSRGSAQLSELKFTVTEPNGISLQPNLVRAVNALYVDKGLVKPGTFVNYNNVQYCMVIRFYGYDEKGNLVMPINQRGGQTDRQAAIEKYIPFSITNIEFKVSNKLVEYSISALPIAQLTAFSTDRGSIPQNFQFQGKSVKDILVGTTQTLADTTTGSNPGALDPAQRAAAAAASTKRQGKPGESIRDNAAAGLPPAPPPPKASYAPYKVGNQQATGLCSALNLYFAEEANKRGGKSDIYEVQFLDPIISDASIVPPGPVDKALAGGNANANAVSDLDPNRQSVDPNIRIRSATAGQQIVQFIDEVVRGSRFISDQQIVTWEVDPKTQKGAWVPNGKANKTFSWYNISCEAIANGYDDVARCNVYRMIYKVSPYQTSVISEYFSQGAFRGVHKVYNYWFTGQNTSVLTFEQSFNSNWSQTMTANAKLPQDIKNAVNSSVVWQRRFMPASNQSREGAEGNVYEAAANAADMLYTQDLNNITLNIIGDPAWIPSPKVPQPGNFVVTPFYPDGTINYLAGAPYFEFAWNRPVDYNLQTGLMDPGLNNSRTNFVDIGGQAQQSVIYGTTNVKSMFKGGKFTQELKGYWLTDGVNKSYTAAAPEDLVRKAEIPMEDGSDNRFARLSTGAGAQTAAETEVAVNNGTTYQNNYGVSPSVASAPIISSNDTPIPLPAAPIQATEVAATAPPPKLGTGGYGFGLRADTTAPVTAGDPQLIAKDA
jgi:hypothetical protein